MKHAVIIAGGRQHVVTVGQRLVISHVPGAAGTPVEFPRLLDFDGETEVTIGQPELATKVKGKILGQSRTRKITIIKFKRKVRYRRKIGHRQPQTTVEITSL